MKQIRQISGETKETQKGEGQTNPRGGLNHLQKGVGPTEPITGRVSL